MKREGTKQSLELEACFCWKYIDSDVCLDWYCEWCYIMSWAGWGRCPYILASLYTTSDGGHDGGPAGAEWAHCRRRVHSLVDWADGRCSVSTAHLHLVQYEALLCSQCMMVGGQRVHRLMVRENHCAHTAVWPPPVRLPPHNILILIS